MQGIIVLGVGLLAFLLFGKKAKAAQAQGEPGGTEPFDAVLIKTVNGESFFDVFAKEGAFGPHARMFVLRYKVVFVGGNARPVMIAESGTAPEEIRARARDEFGLIQAPTSPV